MKFYQEIFNFNIADYAIIAVIMISVVVSLVRGFFKELVSLIIWVLGFWVAIKFFRTFAVVLEPYLTNSIFRQFVSFSGIFVLVLILGSIFNYLLSFVIAKSGLSGTDRLLGMVFGTARGFLLTAVVLLFLSATAFVQDQWWQRSVLIPHFQTSVDWLRGFIPQKITDITNSIKIKAT